MKRTSPAVRPPARTRLSHEKLDELRRSISLAVVRSFTASQIRAQILANLHRWKAQGVWVTAYDEWQDIALSGDDGRLFASMLGRDEDATRLRQSMPYVGPFSRSEVRQLNEQTAAVDAGAVSLR